ncbi:hypothetical protein D9M69_655720 [compost metagenome]
MYVFFLLVGAVQVFAARDSSYGEPSRFVRTEFVAFSIYNTGFITAYRKSGSALFHVVFVRRDKDVQHFRSADAVDDFQSCRFVPVFPDFFRQRFSSRYAFP